MLIDTHAHLYVDNYKDDLKDIVLRAKQAQVEKVILPNIDASTIDSLKNIVLEYPDFFVPMMGLHPTSVDSSYKEQLDIIYKELNTHKDYIA